MIPLLFLQIAATSAPTPAVRFELPNGLRVWVQEERSRPVALVQVTYKAGSLHEGPGITGIAHFVEHMAYRATENIRNEDAYGYIDRIGGRYTGGTWPDVTRYAETVPSFALEAALRVTAERMSRALFDSLEFERERSNVVTEANGFSDQDAVNAFRDAVMSTAFELHPYRYNSNTWARDNLTLSRAEAYAWYRRYYGPNNAVLIVVGDVNTGEVRRLVEKHFASLPRAQQSGEITLREPPQQVEKRVLSTYRGSMRHVEIVHHAPAASDPDYPAFSVMHRLLGLRLSRGASFQRITITDTATQYPYVARIAAMGDSTLDVHNVLGSIDHELASLRRGSVDTMLLRMARDPSAPSAPVAVTATGVVPPRQSNLTRMADSLYERERDPWEVSPSARAHIQEVKRRVTAEQVRDVAGRWLQPWHRTVGFLVPGAEHSPPRQIIPPLTTPPARRMRPEPVPAKALQPLPALAIRRERRSLANGATLRAAQIPVSGGSIHVRVDYGDTSASFTQGLPAVGRDSAFQTAAARARGLLMTRPPKRADSTMLARAREWVLANILPVQAVNASARAKVFVSVAAPQPPDIPLRMAERAFHDFPAPPALREPERSRARPLGDDPLRPQPDSSAMPGMAGEERIRDEGATQVAIVAGVAGVPRGHPDRRALELLSYIVGVPSYGGRLGWALTKAGLTYSSAAVSTFGESSGHILMSTTSDTRNVDAVIQAIREVVEGIAARGVDEWELREAQAFTLGRATLYHARVGSPAEALAAALTESELSGIELLDPPSYSRAYLDVTFDEINRVARAYYRPDRLKVVAIGAVEPAQPSVFPRGTFRALFEP